MPNPENRTGRDFSMYDAMDDEQLRQILRDDASKPEGEDTDMELMLHIMEVLAKRRKEAAQEIPPGEALERFNEIYKHTDNSLISEEKPAKPKRTFNRWQRWVATVAALLVLVFGSSLTAHALGFDLFEIIAKWTKETFHFGYSSDVGETNAPTPNAAYGSLCDALEKYKIDKSIVPTWIPDGYIEGDLKIQETPTQRVFVAWFDCGEKRIRIRVADYLDVTPAQIEQSDELIEIMSHNGTDYYIFENHDQLRAVWIIDNYECFIMGELTTSEIKGIIESIQKKG